MSAPAQPIFVCTTSCQVLILGTSDDSRAGHVESSGFPHDAVDVLGKFVENLCT